MHINVRLPNHDAELVLKITINDEIDTQILQIKASGTQHKKRRLNTIPVVCRFLVVRIDTAGGRQLVFSTQFCISFEILIVCL